MKAENRVLLERAAGIIEGIAYSISNKDISDGLLDAVERIENAINKETEGDNDE